MDIQLTNHRIVSQHKDGDCSGTWRSRSNYSVELFNSQYEKYGYSLFYVGGKLNIDFAAGGILEFKCLLTYHLKDYDGMPNIDMLVETMQSRVPIDLETMFANYDMWFPNSPLEDLWAPCSGSEARLMIEVEFAKHFHS